MPAGAEAVRAEKAARGAARSRTANSRAPIADTGEGTVIIRSSWAGTAVFVVGTGLAAGISALRLPVALLDLVLFFGGVVGFLWALAAAAGRSREREIGLWNLFLLEGAAPRRVRQALLGALALEIVTAIGTVWINVALAFGILVPLWGLAHCGLWGAQHGAFPPRRSQRRGQVSS